MFQTTNQCIIDNSIDNITLIKWWFLKKKTRTIVVLYIMVILNTCNNGINNDSCHQCITAMMRIHYWGQKYSNLAVGSNLWYFSVVTRKKTWYKSSVNSVVHHLPIFYSTFAWKNWNLPLKIGFQKWGTTATVVNIRVYTSIIYTHTYITSN
jgi:hypothetical protein